MCIIGGGVAGLTAALTVAEKAEKFSTSSSTSPTIVLLESTPTLGGRVQSDKTDDGYILDRGFAVFIEEYPVSKKTLNYNDLKLGKFLPGALIKTSATPTLQRVADPLRNPEDLFTSLLSDVGTLIDKVRILRLIFHVRTKTVEELFQEEEMNTFSLLKNHYGFSAKFINEFMKPFLEGIYLAPLEEQSSRMFHFVFKMFSEGAACLPEGGMGRVTKQLENKLKQLGRKVDVRLNQPVARIATSVDGTSFVVTTTTNKKYRAQCVVLATDGKVAHSLLSSFNPNQFASLPEQPQRSVGCLYYSFKGDPPIADPILILNGICSDDDDHYYSHPINNVCFPSAVSKGYAPDGYGLCSVTILGKACEYYLTRNKSDELDRVVRKQLADWFGTDTTKWELKKMYFIKNAQPAQLNGPWAANVNGGRDCTVYQGKSLPKGFLICGDHMATATLNGALEGGIAAGEVAATFCN